MGGGQSQQEVTIEVNKPVKVDAVSAMNKRKQETERVNEAVQAQRDQITRNERYQKEEEDRERLGKIEREKELLISRQKDAERLLLKQQQPQTMIQPKQSEAAEKEAQKLAEMKRLMQEQKRKQAEQL